MAKSLIQEKSFKFALKIVEVYKKLQAEREFVLSRQLLRSGTSIGANVEEALAGQNRRDFMAKMALASKEASETRYWLILLQKSNLTKTELNQTIENNEEQIRILTAIVKTTVGKPATQNLKLKTHN